MASYEISQTSTHVLETTPAVIHTQIPVEEDESEWEYEYSTTETEVRLLENYLSQILTWKL